MNLFQPWIEITSGVILPVPAGYQANETVAWLYTAWAGAFALLILPWIFRRLLKEKDVIPLLMWAGGMICSLTEPMLDDLGHLWYPTNLPGPAFVGFGVNIPWLIPLAYSFFCGMNGYFIYRYMLRGMSAKGIYCAWLILCASDLLVEYPGVFFGAYQYYGDQPFKFLNFPWWWAWINGTAMLMVGFLLWLVAPHLKGWHKASILLVPITAWSGSYFMTAWPDFLALNWRMPNIVAWLLSLFSLGLCLITVRGVIAVVAKES